MKFLARNSSLHLMFSQMEREPHGEGGVLYIHVKLVQKLITNWISYRGSRLDTHIFELELRHHNPRQKCNQSYYSNFVFSKDNLTLKLAVGVMN